jgi:molybdopterin-synthase adenylyltransferase
MNPSRYHRQSLLPQIGDAGQERIRSARVVLLGMGALGATIADQLGRAGVGTLTLIDRDVVEWTNLQRQTLYDESDAKRSLPKVEAAARRLRVVNADVTLDPRPVDVDAGNVESILREARCTLVVDGTDNAATRFLLNDACVKLGLPWVMGASIGTEGRAMPIMPGRSACLRCVFETPPDAGEVDTCDTAGVLGPVVGMVASLQSAMAIRLLVEGAIEPKLHVIEAWSGRFKSVDLRDARRDDCPCCGLKRFEFLEGAQASAGTKLCGRNATQVRPPSGTKVRLDLAALESRLKKLGDTDRSDFMLKFVETTRPELAITIFADGRMILFGTEDPAVARTTYSRIVGN